MGNCLEKNPIPNSDCLIISVVDTLLNEATNIADQINKLVVEYKAIGNAVSNSPTFFSSGSIGTILTNSVGAFAGSVAGQMEIETLDQIILGLIGGMVSDLITTASMGVIGTKKDNNSGGFLDSQAHNHLKQIFGVAENWWLSIATIATIVPESQLVMFTMAKNTAIAYIRQQNLKIDQAIVALDNLRSTLPENDPNSIATALKNIYAQIIPQLASALNNVVGADRALGDRKDAITAANKINGAGNNLLNVALIAYPFFSKSKAPDFSDWSRWTKFALAIKDAQKKVDDAIYSQTTKVTPFVSGVLGWAPIIDKTAFKNKIPDFVIASTIVILSYFNVQVAILLEDAMTAQKAGPTAKLLNLSVLAPTSAAYGTFLKVLADWLAPAVIQQNLNEQEIAIMTALKNIQSLYNPYNDLIEAVQSLYFQAASGFISADAFTQQLDLVKGLFIKLKQYNNAVIGQLMTIPDYADEQIEGAISTLASLTHSSKAHFIANLSSNLRSPEAGIIASSVGNVMACLFDVLPKVAPSEQFIIQQIQDNINAEVQRMEDAAKALIPKPITDAIAASSILNGLLTQSALIQEQIKFLQCLAGVPTVILNAGT
jgi:signal transduction histidine kinase